MVSPSAAQIDRPDHPQLRGPSCSDRMKAGFILGCVVGLTIGGFYGGSQAFKYGVSGREFVRIVGKSMFNVGGSFALFMSVGALIRC